MSEQFAQELVNHPREAMSIEVKRWFDPSMVTGKEKLIKGIFALRNYNGGHLIIGFDNKTLAPDFEHHPHSPKDAFHPDRLQRLVSEFASEPFGIDVYFPVRDDREFVVVEVPSGIKSPVAAKKDLSDSGRSIVRQGDVFFRTLHSNHTVSSASIAYRDWPQMMELCFSNREADIGNFLRRHLSSIDPNTIAALGQTIAGLAVSKPKIDDIMLDLLQDGNLRRQTRLTKRNIESPRTGSFEVGLMIDKPSQFMSLSAEFLRTLDLNNPNLTGWPVWLDSSNFAIRDDRPYVLDGGYEALIQDHEGPVCSHLEFMRKDPTGKFYLWRALQDDVSRTTNAPEPNKELDFGLSLLRVAEAIAVGRSFASALSADLDSVTLHFAFRWRGLEGRALTSWAQRGRSLSYARYAEQDEFTKCVSFPAFSDQETIKDFTYAVVSGLFELFEGFVLPKSVNDDLVSKLLSRTL